jgi:hypothetical protein
MEPASVRVCEAMKPPAPTKTSSTALYKYVGIEGLRRILDGSIRFTQPSAFNDPFELLPELIVPNDTPERQISVSFDIRAPRRTAPDRETEAIPESCRSSDAISRDIVQQLNQLVGVLSLSRVRDSLLMWSHYADQYAGAVVEFDGSHNFFTGQIDVDYRTTRPRRHLDAYLAGEPIPVAELCAKSDQWAYEREVRIVRPLTACQPTGHVLRGFPVFVQSIPAGAIRSVTMGERAPLAEQREIYSRLMETDVSLSLAAVDNSGFAFREEVIKMAVPYSKVGPWMSPRTAHIFSDLMNPRGDVARWLIKHHAMSKLVNRPV